ncbi:MAG: helix-hairpin-helix domain-containing protein [Acidobacteriota bacterium]|nr:helix-hairpin-helix domain-containing protein [Acidobacteriota bacterium]
MKQNSQRANFSERAIALVALAAAFSQLACATLPRYTPTQTQSSFSVPPTQTDLRVNINTASATELEGLPGVGKVIAERIIMHREQYGPFRREEHLMIVRGISDRKFRALRPMITAG